MTLRKATSYQLYSAKELKLLNLGKNTRPYKLKIEEGEVFVDDWTDLCLKFVEYLIKKGFLMESSVPVFNHSNRKQKYFINFEPKHYYPERDGEWKSIGPFFIDTKYNARAHLKNIIRTLYHLNIPNIDIGISFRN